MNCLLLSTPDLAENAFCDDVSAQVTSAYNVRLNQLDQYSSSTVELDIYRFGQSMLQDHQKEWFQILSLTNETLEKGKYTDQLKNIVAKFESDSWLVSDPLLCHSLPVWLSVVDDPTLIFCYSHPLICAQELQQAWRFPIVFGLALWESYVLAACQSLAGRESVLIALSDIGDGNQAYLDQLAKQLHPFSLNGLRYKEKAIPDDLARDFSLPEPLAITYDLLARGDVSTLASRALSGPSRDILDFYGQLRAGYKLIKQERDRLKFELDAANSGDQDGNVQPVVEEPEVLEEPERIEQPLCKVRVHIKGMDTLEFYADPESAVLDMLRANLLNTEQDQLIYLHCGANQDDTLYFMSSALLAMETEPVTQ